jgi:hypothetical protein
MMLLTATDLEDCAMTMMSTTPACSICWNPIGAGARPVWLSDLAFHEVCAPRCRACQSRLTPDDEHRFSYDGNVVSNALGYSLRPTDFWCDDCRELHDRDLTFAQD